MGNRYHSCHTHLNTIRFNIALGPYFLSARPILNNGPGR